MIIFNISISYFQKFSFHYLGKVVLLFWNMFMGCPNKWSPKELALMWSETIATFLIFQIKILFWCLNCFV
jgi:hypothetical protein